MLFFLTKKGGGLTARSNFIIRGGADFSGIKREMKTTQAAVESFRGRLSKPFSRAQREVSKVNSAMKSLKLTMQKSLNGIRREMKKTENASLKFKSALEKNLSRLGLLLAAVFSVSSGMDMARSFMQSQSAADRLAKVMQNTMSATKSQINAVMSLTEEYQRLGVVGTDIQQAGLQELSTYLTEIGSIRRLLPTLNDMLAQQYGYNATAEQSVTIATMLGKVMNGQVSALSRYGYSFTEAQANILKFGTEAERAAVLAEVVGESVGGMNEALGRTPIGRIKQLSNNFGALRETVGKTLIIAFMPFIDILNAIIARLTAVFSLINNLLGRAFNVSFDMPEGIGVGTSFNGGDVFEDIAENAGGAAGAVDGVSGAVKKLKKALAGFDDLNILSFNNDTGGGASGGSGGGIGSGGIGGISSIGDFDSIIEEDANGLDFLSERLEAIKTLTAPTVNAIKNLADALSLVKDFTFQALKDFYEHFLKPVGAWTLGEGLPRFFNALADGVRNVNWSAINQSLADLWSALAPFAINIGEGLLWFFENVLVPLGSWTMSNIVPLFLDILSSSINVINSAIEALKPLGLWLYDEFLQPLAKWTGGVIIDVLGWIVEKLRSLSDLIKQNDDVLRNMIATIGIFASTFTYTLLLIPEEMDKLKQNLHTLWNNIVEIFKKATDLIKLIISDSLEILKKNWSDHFKDVLIGIGRAANDIFGWFTKLVDEFITPIISRCLEWMTHIWKNSLKNVVDEVLGFVGRVGELIVLLWERHIKPYVDFQMEYVLPVVRRVIEIMLDVIGGFVSFMADKVGMLLGMLNGLIDFLIGAFTGDWDRAWSGVGKIFESVFDGMTKIAKNAANLIIDVMSGMIGLVADGINFLIGSLNNIKIPGMDVGINIPTINAPRIPRLASGTVVPPNNEFLAILGDNRREPEVVSPLSTIKKAVLEAFGEASFGDRNADRPITINFSGDGAELVSLLMPSIVEEANKMTSQRGVSVFKS